MLMLELIAVCCCGGSSYIGTGICVLYGQMQVNSRQKLEIVTVA